METSNERKLLDCLHKVVPKASATASLWGVSGAGYFVLIRFPEDAIVCMSLESSVVLLKA